MNLYINTHLSEHSERILGGKSATLINNSQMYNILLKKHSTLYTADQLAQVFLQVKKFKVSTVKEQQKITVPYFNILLVL